MTKAGRCIVCGLVPEGSSTLAEVCDATCAREAEAELLRLDGRLHQLAQLESWKAAARRWEIALRPAQRRQAQLADVEMAALDARRALLTQAIDGWRAAAPPRAPSTRSGPGPLGLAASPW